MRYLLGLDNGGTSSKAVLFDQTGRAVASASRMTPMETPRVGHTERDMELLWQANCEVSGDHRRLGVDAADIAGVSFSATQGAVLWGAARSRHPGIVSTKPGATNCGGWYREARQRAFPLTCQSVLASQAVALINWFQQNQRSAGKDEVDLRRQGLVRYRLTGEAFAKSPSSPARACEPGHRRLRRRNLKLLGLEETGTSCATVYSSVLRQGDGRVRHRHRPRRGHAVAGAFSTSTPAIGHEW
jgi:L-xylulokinase